MARDTSRDLPRRAFLSDVTVPSLPRGAHLGEESSPEVCDLLGRGTMVTMPGRLVTLLPGRAWKRLASESGAEEASALGPMGDTAQSYEGPNRLKRQIFQKARK